MVLFNINLLGLFLACGSASSQQLPNILLILSDDQDVELNGMLPMSQTMELLGRSGTVLSNAFTSTPICCPARASLLTGQFAHNHKTVNNSVSGGCNGLLWRRTMEPRALPVLLQNRGYRTFYAGKYLNQYKGAEVPPGWNEFYGLHGNSRYYNYTLRENAQNISYTDTYLTDLLRERAAAFLLSASKQQQPFFAIVAPPAAHAPFTPAPRHSGVFANVRAPRTPNFNRVSETPLEKHWLVSSGQRLPSATVATVDEYFGKRWETLLSVDEMVATLIKLLDESKSLDNTYVIYTSDNGYHMGQFAQPFDKRQPYETDIRVPLLIRGPGVPKDSSLPVPVSLLDLAPTILEWADMAIPAYMDGRSFKQDLLNANRRATLERTLLIEYWGEGNADTYNAACPGRSSDRLAGCTPDADCHCQDAWNNTYACVRDFRYQLNRIYCEFRDNEDSVEAYDLAKDQYQMNNYGYDMLPIERALYSLMLKNLTKCAGRNCEV